MASLGCQHYKRKARLLAPCCNKEYVCRFCHDDKEEHQLDRKSITRVVCMVCNERQGVRNVCVQCWTRFGNYYCGICRLFDDEDKLQFHCYDCGICRVGGKANFYHCHTCNICLNIRLQGNNHKCVQGGSLDCCTVCLDDLHSSRDPLTVPLCGHFIHEKCYKALKNNSINVCPKCKEPFELAMMPFLTNVANN